MKYIFVTLLTLTIAYTADAQNIIIRDGAGNIVNSDTVEVSPQFVQKPPYTTINAKFYAQNNTGVNINLGAKKAEHRTDPDAAHAICFETQCFTPNVYVAPVTVPLAPMGIDSSFKGSYLYLDSNHTPGKYLVSYTLFNNNNPADSAIVYVLYNTIPSTTGIASATLQNNISIYPNPARDAINITSPHKMNGMLTITNGIGAVVYRQTINDAQTTNIATNNWATGVYHYNLQSEKERVAGSFTKQ